MGFIAVAKSHETVGEEINISSNFEISMENTLNLIKEIMNSEVVFSVDTSRVRPANSEVFRLWGDNDKLFRLTNFKPMTSIRDGLISTTNWYLEKNNLSKYKAHLYNV